MPVLSRALGVATTPIGPFLPCEGRRGVDRLRFVRPPADGTSGLPVTRAAWALR